MTNFRNAEELLEKLIELVPNLDMYTFPDLPPIWNQYKSTKDAVETARNARDIEADDAADKTHDEAAALVSLGTIFHLVAPRLPTYVSDTARSCGSAFIEDGRRAFAKKAQLAARKID